MKRFKEVLMEFLSATDLQAVWKMLERDRGRRPKTIQDAWERVAAYIAERGTPPSASTLCAQCANGRFTNRLNIGICPECLPGTFDHDTDPSTPCADCIPGRYTPSGQTTCTSCPAGQYDRYDRTKKVFDQSDRRL